MTPQEIAESLLSGMDPIVTEAEDLFLSGLGAQLQQRLNLSQNQIQALKPVINAVANRRAGATIQATTMNPAQRTLTALALRNKLNADTNRAVREGNAGFLTKNYYVRKQLSAGDIQEIFDGSEEEVVGVRNIANRVFSKTVAVVVSGIRLAYAFGGSGNNIITEPANVKYTNAVDAETAGSSPVDVPNAFLNGEIEFKNGDKVFLRLPVKSFFRDSLSISTSVEGKSDAVQIKPEYFEQNKEVQVSIRYAKTAAGAAIALPAGNHFVEVQFLTEGITNKK